MTRHQRWPKLPLAPRLSVDALMENDISSAQGPSEEFEYGSLLATHIHHLAAGCWHQFLKPGKQTASVVPHAGGHHLPETSGRLQA